MMEVFAPPMNPSVESAGNVQARVRMAEFGDGYSQRGRDGLNHLRRRWTLAWGMLSQAQFDEIEAFLIARGGDEAFLYMLPGDSAQRQWTAAGWQAGFVNGIDRSLRVEIEESFDIAIPPLAISGTPVLTATDGEAYAGFTVAATGGTLPYTFSVAEGSLPSGISLDASTGEVAGTPTEDGEFAGIVIRVTDGDGTTADLDPFTLTVEPAEE